ncbi:MAG: hypothetical protein GY913_27485 [Proteobacteria bacterium]|nr:hypothetical protein [Pseudomonadota bacterium]MCP4920659.1 hypothetical protein [Pseudomonadota bacterium]
MIEHVAEVLLARFVRGDLDESTAVSVALHLDDCPRCSTRATALDPLASAFAACDDPFLPEDLVQQVLDEAAGIAVKPLEPPMPRMVFRLPELVAAGGLLSAAALLFVGLGDPAGLATDAALAASAGITAANLVATDISAGWMLMPLAAIAFLMCVLVASGFGRRQLFTGRSER